MARLLVVPVSTAADTSNVVRSGDRNFSGALEREDQPFPKCAPKFNGRNTGERWLWAYVKGWEAPSRTHADVRAIRCRTSAVYSIGIQ